MAVDFNKYTNYLNTANVCNVVFGADSPVLEVELNEIQEIQQEVIKNLIKFISHPKYCYIKGEINVSNNTLVIDEGTIIIANNEIFVFKSDYSVNIGSFNTSTNVYFNYKRVLVEPNIPFNYNGILNNATKVNNWSTDSRYGVLTTKRYVKEISISIGSPLTDYTSVPLGVCVDSGHSYSGDTAFVPRTLNTLYPKLMVANFDVTGDNFFIDLGDGHVGIDIPLSKLYDLNILRAGETRYFLPDEIRFEFFINGLYIPVYLGNLIDLNNGQHTLSLPDTSDYEDGSIVIKQTYLAQDKEYASRVYKKENDSWSELTVNPYTNKDIITVKIERIVPFDNWNMGFKDINI